MIMSRKVCALYKENGERLEDMDSKPRNNSSVWKFTKLTEESDGKFQGENKLERHRYGILIKWNNKILKKIIKLRGYVIIITLKQ